MIVINAASLRTANLFKLYPLVRIKKNHAYINYRKSVSTVHVYISLAMQACYGAWWGGGGQEMFLSFVWPQWGTDDALLTDTGSGGGGGAAPPPPDPRRRRAGAAVASACTDAATSNSASNTTAAPAGPLALPPPCILIRTCVHYCSKCSSSTGRSRERSRDACWMLIRSRTIELRKQRLSCFQSSKPWCLLIACMQRVKASFRLLWRRSIVKPASWC